MLLSATEQGDLESVQALTISENLEEKNTQGFTALAIACKLGFSDIVQVLLDSKANANSQNNVKFTQ